MANFFNTDIRLTPAQYNLLKSIRKQSPIRDNDNNLLKLQAYGLVEHAVKYDGLNTIVDYESCRITPDGIDYIAYNKDEYLNIKLPIVISIISIILSIAAFIKSFFI